MISTGRPDQDSFSLAASILNPGGDAFDGVVSEISISAADRFNSPIPDGSVIFFSTEYGKVASSCATTDGACAVAWTSQAPRQPLFSSFEEEDGTPAYVRTIFNTPCSSQTGNTRGIPCPRSLGQPVGGRSSVMAYTLGDEDFVDANANGLFDAGERFVDLPEAFLDHNEDGAFGNSSSAGSCHPNCPEPGGDEEIFIDDNDDGVYSIGNGIYNGSLCSSDAAASGACSTEPVTVSSSIVILVSGSEPFGAFYTSSNTNARPLDSISVGSNSNTYAFYTADLYNGKLPSGTTVDISSPNCPLQGMSSFSVLDTNAAGPSRFEFTVQGGTSSEVLTGDITATVAVPESSGIGRTEDFSIPCTINACGAQPAPSFCDSGGG